MHLFLAVLVVLLLHWQDNSMRETGFDVERSRMTGGSGYHWSPLVTLPTNTTDYTDTGVRAGWTYCYRVRAEYVEQFALSYTAYTNIACGTAK